MVVINNLTELSTIRFGADVNLPDYVSRIGIDYNFKDVYVSSFAEGDIFINPKLAARVGLRAEHSQVLDTFNLAPRTSLAYKTGKESQVSVAYGWFYQSPDRRYIWNNTNTNLLFEKATHYLINYQKANDKRTFRAELYFKEYKNLVSENNATISNKGYGFAKGIDVFYRDRKSIKYGDFWISYSYIDSKRKYRSFPSIATPTFVANHTVSLVYKQFFPKRNLSVGATYSFNSGRPYFNPNNPIYLSDRTPYFHNFSMNTSYLTQLFKNFTVIVLSVDNVLGINNTFGYNYSSDGSRREAIHPAARRGIFIGMFMSLGVDRGENTNND